MIASNITRNDSGLLNRITNIARRYTTKVHVGYFGSTPITNGSSSSITMSRLATIHELGLGRVPQRMFVGASLDKNRGKYARYVGSQITPVIRGTQTANNVWQTLGTMAVADVQQYMITATFTPLAPATIERKGSSKPLIDTGQMRQAITYRVK